MLTSSEEDVLLTFRRYLMTPNQMLCFSGPGLQKKEPALRSLTKKDLLVEESFSGGYSLTREGYMAMKRCAATN